MTEHDPSRSADPTRDPKQLYLRWRAPVFDLLLRRLGNVEEAENVLQEAMLRSLRAHDEGKVHRFGAFVMRVATNLATDRLRRRRFVGEVADVESALSVEASPSQVEHGRLRRAVERLPVDQREVIRLRYDEGLSFAEIARALHMSKNGVFARHGRALDGLRADFARRRST